MVLLSSFFQNNIWASALVLILIALAMGIFMFYRTKRTLDKLADENPHADFWSNKFGKTWGRIVPFLLFLVFIILSWFITRLYY